MSLKFSEIITLEKFECIKCGIPFAMPESLAAALRREAGSFHCPNGHSQGWHESEEDRLRKKLVAANCEALKERNARLEAEQKLAEEVKDKARLARRVRSGVCPCCNRTFSNLARHMKTKHQEKQ